MPMPCETAVRETGILKATNTGSRGRKNAKTRKKTSPSMPWMPGDIIAFSGRHWDSLLINLLSYGIPYHSLSHVGILGENQGELLLFESTTLSNLPCKIQGKPVKGVQAILLEDRLASYQGKVYHYPLATPLDERQRNDLSTFLLEKIGTDYDYLGAMRSAGIGISWVESKLNKECLRELFCSELCAAAHKMLGVLATDNASKWNPNRLIRYELKRRILLKPERLK